MLHPLSAKLHPLRAKAASVTGGTATTRRRCWNRLVEVLHAFAGEAASLAGGAATTSICAGTRRTSKSFLLAPAVIFAGTADDGGEPEAATLKMLRTTVTTRWNHPVGEVQSSAAEAGPTGGHNLAAMVTYRQPQSRQRW